MKTQPLSKAGKDAARLMMSLGRQVKEEALVAIGVARRDNEAAIMEANLADIGAARDAGVSAALLSRLRYDHKKLFESLTILRALQGLPDPSGIVREARLLDDGLELRRVSCPIGLIALVFESRPDALVQMAGLAVKSGNAIIVKGGREAERTNRVLARVVAEAGQSAGLPVGWLGAIETRAEVGELLALDEYVDLIIPRGSNDFVHHIMEASRIPVLGHADGVCHVYIHTDADTDMAVNVTVDSKTQYPAACNTAEVLLVDRSVAPVVLPRVAQALEAQGVALELCPEAMDMLGPGPGRSLKNDTWSVEYLELRMAVMIVGSLEEAVTHINRYGSGHTDSIVTGSAEAASMFMAGVDSASVYHNASTRFADGDRESVG